MLERLDAPAIRLWSVAAADVLEAHRAEIDELNVYPVPDGDTGTNLALTLRAAADALAADGSATASAALQALARGAVLGARGNSGVIVSQILRGLAETPPIETLQPDVPPSATSRLESEAAAEDERAGARAGFDAAGLQSRLRTAADRAYEAVSQPVEGTILTVARAAADAAQLVVPVPPHALASVMRATLTAAIEALARTPEQLPVLARAGVVDAGGRGLVLLFEALARVVDAESTPASSPGGSAGSSASAPAGAPRSDRALTAAREAGSPEFAYEVQYLLDAAEPAVLELRARLGGLGDSLVVVGTGDGSWNVHVHVNDVGAALEAGIEAGRPYRVTVTRFDDQLSVNATVASASASVSSPSLVAGEPKIRTVAVVAVANADGLAQLFQAEGVRVVQADPAASPSTAELLAAIRAAGVTHVVLLPNSGDITAVAETAAREARQDGIRVSVVPTRSPVQGLAAVAVHDAERRFDDNVVAMAEASAATHWAEVTVAARESLTSVGTCRPGDVLGLIDGEVVLIGDSVGAMARSMVDRLVGVGSELITVVTGEQADAEDVQALQAHLEGSAPLVDLVFYEGGQAHYPFLIGAE